MSRFFGPLRQMGFVVRDIDKAMRHWVEICGVGPWYITEKLPLNGFWYKRGPPRHSHRNGRADSDPPPPIGTEATRSATTGHAGDMPRGPFRRGGGRDSRFFPSKPGISPIFPTPRPFGRGNGEANQAFVSQFP